MQDRKARFEERSVEDDQDVVRELQEKYKSQSTPTVIIDDQIVIGFDPERLDELLER